jgi:FlaG/FlaF family flagellin (archaellin)
MKKTILILSTASLGLVFGCKKQSQTPVQEEITAIANNNGTSGFTAPTNNYYKIDDSTNTVSADVVHCDMNGGYVSLTKNFTNINIQPSQLSLTFDSLGSSTNRQIRNQISEGGYKIFTIDTVNYKDSDKMRINLNISVYGSNSGTYYYLATGKLYVSKKNNKLRFTTQGKLTVIEKKHLATGFSGSIYSRTLEFSIEEGAHF